MKICVVTYFDDEDQRDIIIGVTKTAKIAKQLISEDRLETTKKRKDYDISCYDVIEAVDMPK